MQDDLRHASIGGNCAREADIMSHSRDRPDSRPIPSPNDGGEDLVWVGSIQVYERGSTGTPIRGVLARDSPTNRRVLIDVACCLCCGDALGESWGQRKRQNKD
jgi:hypothetical protein